MKLDVATLTDPGRQRQENEDNVWAQLYSTSQGDVVGLFIVCDGMGGHLGGKYASYWAIESLKHDLGVLFCPGDPRATLHLSRELVDEAVEQGGATQESLYKQIEQLILEAIQKANQVVYEYAKQKPQKAADAGTTLSMAALLGSQAIIANVGDSRTYLLRDRKLHQITRDHSLVASLVASGQLEAEEVYTHPQRNMIYRSLGQKKEVQVDFFRQKLQSGDCLMFCSDGLWEMVRKEAAMAKIIEKAATLEQACTDLIEAANAAGGEDNISVVLARVR